MRGVDVTLRPTPDDECKNLNETDIISILCVTYTIQENVGND
jgi:hypothetical protein